jgi:tight adherence protein C
MTFLFYIVATMTGFCGLALVACIMLSRSSRAASRRIHNIVQGKREAPAAVRKSESLRKKMYKAMAWLRERLGMGDDPKLLQRFEAAGLRPSSRDVYITAKILGPLLVFALASFISYKRAMWMIALPAIFYLAPDFILKYIVSSRRERIRLGVPDMIDLLVICVDAGLGMDQALLRVAQELGKRHPDIQQELLRINREQRAGKQRIEAWQAMAARTRLTEIEAFVNMLMQTERFGTPIARALSAFGDGIREKRRQKAEELAAKTTVKILFPLVLCIFPCIFIVLLGPPGISIARGLAGGFN